MSNVTPVSNNLFSDNSEVTNTSSSGSSEFWSACILALSAACCITRCCLKHREIKRLTIDDYLNNPKNLSKLKRAGEGTIPVYLGEGFVIKKCPHAEKRFKSTDLLREVVERHNYSYLIVPHILQIKEIQTRIINGNEFTQAYSVEERLPIHDAYRSIKIYEDNYAAFTPAVLQFVDLKIRYTFGDLVSRFTPTVPRPRYDNLCPYLENGIGKFGLVDADYFETILDDDGSIKYCDFDTCLELIHLFPYHAEEIVEVMEKNGLKLNERDMEQLVIAREAQLKLRKAYRK